MRLNTLFSLRYRIFCFLIICFMLTGYRNFPVNIDDDKKQIASMLDSFNLQQQQRLTTMVILTIIPAMLYSLEQMLLNVGTNNSLWFGRRNILTEARPGILNRSSGIYI